jgi:putative intracellular protease/amidase
MKGFAQRVVTPSVLLPLLVLLASLTAAADVKRYKCPPCGAPCDTTTFFAAGVCPACNMTLVEEGSLVARPDPNRKKVAILVFDACQILDFAGPYEMFGAAGADVYTVAATRDPVTTAMGLTVVPRYTFADAPQPDVLVIPGGGVNAASRDEATLRYIRQATEKTTQTMSVCNGAFILANTGLLDGLSATTTNGNIPRMAAEYPKIRVVRDQRYVDNGHLITTAGLSAGMDGALHVIARLYGTGYAQAVALGEEYDWQATSKYARAALADQQVPPLNLDSLGTWNIERTEGDTRRWESVITGKLTASTAEFASWIDQSLAAHGWSRTATHAVPGGAQTSTWRFKGNDGKPWKATLRLDGNDAAHTMRVTASVARE